MTCTEGKTKGKTSNAGSSSETVKGNFEAWTWGGCSTTVDALSLGSLEVHWIAGTNNATLTGSGSTWTYDIFGVSCAYGTGTGTDLGTLTGSATSTSKATIDVATVISKQQGGFLCPSDVRWTASYVITEPVPLYVSES